MLIDRLIVCTILRAKVQKIFEIHKKKIEKSPEMDDFSFLDPTA